MRVQEANPDNGLGSGGSFITPIEMLAELTGKTLFSLANALSCGK
jgi:hypothetical protein